MKKTIQVQYFAILREQAGTAAETVQTEAENPGELYQTLRERHGFTLEPAQLKVAVNDDFAPWDAVLADSDRVVFIPPVAGG
ncbi:MAG: molybdopterin converting factor subunit 1 [Verrucomicrobia bacterium]|nr:MAG: molybdopterin converting factor subunit 1 [Verrucomicrobiota bacterium]